MNSPRIDLGPSVRHFSIERRVASPLVEALEQCLMEALFMQQPLAGGIYDVVGMSGRRYRYFINSLIRRLGAETRYLEIGTWMGSTLCAAVHANKVNSVVIDNWAQFEGTKEKFLANLNRLGGPDAKVRLIESDFRAVDYSALGPFNVYLFDGPHKYQDQFDALALARVCLDDEFVFIVDDWNAGAVRKGTLDAIKELGFKVLFQSQLRTTLDNSLPPLDKRGEHSDWHNGYYFSVLKKGAAVAAPAV